MSENCCDYECTSGHNCPVRTEKLVTVIDTKGNPDYPFELLDEKPSIKSSILRWVQDLFFTCVYVIGSVALGALFLAVLVWATGLHRVTF